jgi:hypothetical protein
VLGLITRLVRTGKLGPFKLLTKSQVDEMTRTLRTDKLECFVLEADLIKLF